MPKKIDPELKARAVCLVNEPLGEYPSLTAAAAVVANEHQVPLDLPGEVLGRALVGEHEPCPTTTEHPGRSVGGQFECAAVVVDRQYPVRFTGARDRCDVGLTDPS